MYAAANVEKIKACTDPAKSPSSIIGNGITNGTKEVNTLHVEAGKAYKFEIHSIDVNHSFNIHDYVVLMDAVPGRVNTVWFAPDKAGEHDIQCREYCGLIHYNMRGKLIVEEPST